MRFGRLRIGRHEQFGDAQIEIHPLAAAVIGADQLQAHPVAKRQTAQMEQ